MVMTTLADSAISLNDGEEMIGQVNPDRSIRVVLHIKHGQDALDAEADRRTRDPLGAGRHLTRAEFASRFALSHEAISRIRRFSRQAGLHIVPHWTTQALGAARFVDRTVILRGRAAAVGRAFGVRLVHVRTTSGKIYRSYLGNISVPSEVDDLIGNVFNLDTRPRAKPHFRQLRPYAGGQPSGPISYTPLQIAAAYGFPTNVTGKGQTIGILEFGGGGRVRNLRRYFDQLGLQMPAIQAIGVAGADNAPSWNPNGPDGEVNLDIEVAGAIANGASFVVYFAPNTAAGFYECINAAVHDSVNNPTILSLSWGGPEKTWTRPEMLAISEPLKAASVMGISVFVAAGDSGSTDGLTQTRPHVDFPASSPWATACGGTSLPSVPPTPQTETVWNDGSEGGTGGGISAVFKAPSYQSGLQYNQQPLAMRGMPDVAGCADPNTGYEIMVDGVSGVFGGTSAVAPLWAALTALLNESTGTPLGFLNPLLYLTNLRLVLNDIQVGNNDTTGQVHNYAAGPLWDPCSGWGSPNGAAMLAALA